MESMLSKFKKGFSLIELLVVIAIIGILAAVGITAYSGYTTSAKEKASSAQHAQIVALLNAEFSKCAAGSGEFIWTGNCNAAVDDATVATHLSGTGAGQLGMNNPYNTGAVAATHLESQTAQTVVGGIGIFCTGGTAGVCTVRTLINGTTELVKEIPRY